MNNHSDEHYMARALSLAQKGLGWANPNPLVGCVLVKDGRIIGEGYHHQFGGPHAEVEAIRKAGAKSRGATLYVNLEPCNIWGKTPPCTDLVIGSGIRRVVAAVKDPNPAVSGRGVRLLQKAGIRVTTGILQKEAESLNRVFLTAQRKKRPYVTLKAAVTLDGKTATRTGQSRWITGPEARAFGYRLRTQVDAILVGGETVRRDDPSLTSHGLGRDPIRVVFSNAFGFRKDLNIFNSKAPTWIVTSSSISKKTQYNMEQNGAQILKLSIKNGEKSIKHYMNSLFKIGINHVLLESGGKLTEIALSQDMIDELYLFVSPLIFGGQAAPSWVSGTGISAISSAWRLTGASISRVGNDFLIHGFIKH
ncbi:MAG TPA: bifunctional diaminohydroxyphosphoribosylaminopyrimidine deaminase/5-amino-6-(5-phosphoribosylamino)uracil reductase RibD [Elusimicrobiota bacterium]|nr:bifunctional diaminohydroxyphosphoribosylaminopyrimidine deaminase/5-amino-6-(5-phosphoribosylamino)uracil reductase RibD [Elusimicrobiota bacterium]